MTELAPPNVREIGSFPKVNLGHYPTPLELMPRISDQFGGKHIYVKRDDCTGLGLGGNKVRQLEFYLGDALAQGCDTVLSTGAIQSNYMRTLAAAASKLGLECHIQLEDRVAGKSSVYHSQGNKLLTSMFGAKIYYYDEGEDEEAADQNIQDIAADLAKSGKKPYVVPLKPVKQPKGAFGYVEAAKELLEQCETQSINPDLYVVGSGSGLTHSGLLTGLRLLGSQTPVLGACVRRAASLQGPRVLSHCRNIEAMVGCGEIIAEDDVWVDDRALAPGYGQLSELVTSTIQAASTLEGLLLDPVYSGKTLACLLDFIRSGEADAYHNIVFVHTGGTPVIFAYQEAMSELNTER